MKLNRKKGILLLTAAVLILVCGVGGTLAYLITQTAPVTNTFTPAKVTSQVIETMDGKTKSDVQIENTGNVSAYIRAAIVITWKDKDGYTTMPTVPVLGQDYELEINANDWSQSDGYYYYNGIVAAGGRTANLINSCKSTGSYTDGRSLCVEVIGSAIQAEPTTAVQEAWGFVPGSN